MASDEGTNLKVSYKKEMPGKMKKLCCVNPSDSGEVDCKDLSVTELLHIHTLKWYFHLSHSVLVILYTVTPFMSFLHFSTCLQTTSLLRAVTWVYSVGAHLILIHFCASFYYRTFCTPHCMSNYAFLFGFVVAEGSSHILCLSGLVFEEDSSDRGNLVTGRTLVGIS